MNKAIFLDRDGTINVDTGYLYKVEDLVFLPGVTEAIKSLNDTGYLVIVITNQSGIARGMYSEEDMNLLHRYMSDKLKEKGAVISKFYYCPHGPNDNCSCRKPKPGMILKAAADFNINLSESWFIGDSITDIEAGQAAGTKTILIKENDNILDLVRKNILID